MPETTAMLERSASQTVAPPSVTTQRRPKHALTHTVLISGAIAMVTPFVWQVLTALRTSSDATQVPPRIIPQDWQPSNFTRIFDTVPFAAQFTNSVALTAGRTVSQVVLCSLAGYAFARLKFPGRGLIFGLFLSVLMVPPQLFLIPQYQIMQNLHWLNSMQALIVPGMFSAFGTFLMRQFFAALPVEIEEAARLDGANPFQIFRYVAAPLARPGMVALGILTIIWAWNDLLWPLVVNNDPKKMPLSAGLASLQGEHFTDVPLMMAGATIATAPMIIAFVLLQKQFIQGIALSGLKG
jgi:multiple sugar transport system permease protein